MAGQVEGALMKRRTRRMSALAEEVILEALGFHEGEEVEVMVTEVGKPGTGTVMARDRRYNPVVLPVPGEGGLPVGSVLPVRLVEARGVYLVGEPV